MPFTEALTNLHNQLGQIPSAAFFVELLLKSTLILLICHAVTPFVLTKAAARQHLLWALTIVSLSCLPLFLSVIPELGLAVLTPLHTANIAANDLAALTMYWPWILKLYLLGLVMVLLANALALIRIMKLSYQATRSINDESKQVL